MKKEVFYIPSSDQKNKVYGISWEPSGEICGVVQLVHGMTEHMERYHDFACYLMEQGFAVIGHDHLGHGHTAACDEDLGYLGPDKGYLYALEDVRQVTAVAKQRWPGVPVFLLGHSMGSFFVRRYITLYGEGLAGAIVMGTGYYPKGLVWAGRSAARICCRLFGPRKRSKLLYQMALGGNNRAFRDTHPRYGWLSRDYKELEKYQNDKYCTFFFTNAAYLDLFSLLGELSGHPDLARIPKNLPILLVSGQEDPIGGRGAGVKKVTEEFKAQRLTSVTMKLYEGARHEILNELERQTTYQDIAEWLQAHK